MSKLSIEQLVKAKQAAQDVIDMLAGKETERLSIDHWDFLNDVAAPPAVVKAMADELLNLRRAQSKHWQRVMARALIDNPENLPVTLSNAEFERQYLLGEFKREPEVPEEDGRVERPYSQPATHAYGKPIK